MDQTLAYCYPCGENAQLTLALMSSATTEIPALKTTAMTDYVTQRRFPDAAKPDADNLKPEAAQ